MKGFIKPVNEISVYQFQNGLEDGSCSCGECYIFDSIKTNSIILSGARVHGEDGLEEGSWIGWILIRMGCCPCHSCFIRTLQRAESLWDGVKHTHSLVLASIKS